MKKLLSIVVPIYGDGTLVPVFYKAVLEANIQCALEFIFVCDGGGLDEEAFMKAFAERQSNVRGVILSRNFGQHIALSAGYKEAKGDFVCMMNVDLQDPPSEINKLLESMEGKDVDVVYGLRDRRRDNLIKRMSSHLFNWTLNKLTGDNTPLNVATLRIMSRRFVDV